ncbi:hypothetical protein JHK82_019678 [Glycine max]|uniref:Uncharacterized protein n=2 Tax=Glycine subgen. Soja TaxID=1462606 RepID=K7L3J0_SOYBN|nr:hypothetical protein JHK85_020120 [Glycine max]RZC04389.1 hypothetical protein D0Y65_018813 [Glycine soja]KAG5038856.1 hypothetical protein JHK86_019696 [Glycine max]KAG5143983.1 hypothetical protein JHK82_019678 [Glycine max]KAH1088336.1 hypothetical protein GYH30_019399 [Glycine max]
MIRLLNQLFHFLIFKTFDFKCNYFFYHVSVFFFLLFRLVGSYDGMKSLRPDCLT